MVQRVVKVSEKQWFTKMKKFLFEDICWPLKLCLRDFAEQSLHCSIILRGKDMDFRAKIKQQMRFFLFLKKYFNMWQLCQGSIAPWWPLFRKKNKLQDGWQHMWPSLSLGSLPWFFFTNVILPYKHSNIMFTFSEIRLGTQTLGKFNNGPLTLNKFTQGIFSGLLPLVTFPA